MTMTETRNAPIASGKPERACEPEALHRRRLRAEARRYRHREPAEHEPGEEQRADDP
jgi:hypothetical protein